VLLIELFAHLALALAKSAYVLEGGRIRYSGTAQELKARPELLHSAYMRSEAAGTEGSVPPAPARP
jgi:branched-chain amino acid transport system ATP-binding protein